MRPLTLATYALRRQRLAVQRALQANTVEESARAARWAGAWQRLVEAQLDLAERRVRPSHRPPARRVWH